MSVSVILRKTWQQLQQYSSFQIIELRSNQIATLNLRTLRKETMGFELNTSLTF